MEIQKTIKAPSEFVFDKIAESGLYDIRQQVHQDPGVKHLTGFEYTKSFGKNKRGRIKFDEVTRPSVYAFSTYTNRQTFHTRWEMTAIDAETTDVKITEGQDSNGFFQSFNDKVMGFVFGRAKKKQMLAILSELEKMAPK
jgi:hypothetical protein